MLGQRSDRTRPGPAVAAERGSMAMALSSPAPSADPGAWLAPITDRSAWRHEARIASILGLSEALGTPISVAYLDSCDVRELPPILARLQVQYRRAGRHRPGLRGLLA